MTAAAQSRRLLLDRLLAKWLLRAERLLDDLPLQTERLLAERLGPSGCWPNGWLLRTERLLAERLLAKWLLAERLPWPSSSRSSGCWP